MKYSRIWAMPNKNTFSIKPIKEFIDRYHNDNVLSIDPFSNKNRIALISNDLDPDMEADYCMDALDFLKTFEDNSVGIVYYDPPFCYDKKTEVLTKKGWECFSEVKFSDKIATLNTKTNTLEYQNPTEIVAKRYSGKMIKIESQSINLLITPNHRMWGKDTFYGDYYFDKAENLLNKGVSWFQKNVDYIGEEKEYFELPPVELLKSNRFGEKTKPTKYIKMDLWLKFLGLFISEGCTHKNNNDKYRYTISIAQKKGHIRDIIREILKEFPYNCREEKRSFRIQDKQLWTYLHQFGKSHEKYITDEIKELSKRQLKILIKYLMHGDGTNIRYKKLNIKANKTYHYDTNHYYTSSKKLMNDFSEIAIKCGWAISIQEKKKKEYRNVYSIHMLKSKHFKVHKKNISEIKDFDDYVYCVSVPNTTVLVKRKGRVCWSGNSPRQVSECYKKLGKTVNFETTQASFWGDLKKEISRIVQPDGWVFSFGWNSGGIGKTNGFKLEEVLLVPHGGQHNDTICTAEQKIS